MFLKVILIFSHAQNTFEKIQFLYTLEIVSKPFCSKDFENSKNQESNTYSSKASLTKGNFQEMA